MSDDGTNLNNNQIDISSIETMLLLAELNAKNFTESHSSIKNKREALKEEVSQTSKAYDHAMWELRMELEKQLDILRLEKEEKTAAAKAEADALATAEWEARIAARKAAEEVESLQRQLDQAKRAALKASEWATLEQRWDLLTMGAPWREWAKDHQISGAKKIVYEGRLILGDTMGLGKTLTSIIAMDMIQAATKDATPETPVSFGNVNNYS
jgi:SNF2 family DNA or RNA helicase